MSTGSARPYREAYETPHGTGCLVWEGGVATAHILPGAGGFAEGSPPAGIASGGSWLRCLPDAKGRKSLLARTLEEYFSGYRVEFTKSMYGPRSHPSDFAAAIAEALAGVAYGTTISYSGLAAAAGYPRAQRAVGSWLARNPLPVIVPCHRVIRADGRPGRYSGGEGWKLKLLQLEGIYL